ncbi:TadE/TadG family type IV pilus assembly protein [Sansalvadorimonas verongulae]|uniref:TadE/TadG family type IV pilus assembly protein n=1 Tax=Sansalvadorimonas verongulae TaxID=2172824 RepID=UPI0012BD44AF|nr:pilus assembly protein [Sansalvadorimonas verongulae]MTI15564.1 pilus assembly protein [Sansalvadorimonas verongulae]
MFKEKGTVAIETAFGMFFFLFIVLFWCEISYMGFVSATLDYAIAETSRSARTAPAKDYRESFRRALRDSHSLWAPVIQVSKLSLQTYYYDTVTELSSEHCPKTAEAFCSSKKRPKHAAIAVYRIQYSYEPFFASLFSSNGAFTTLSREVISIQEYERSSFGG